MPEARVVAGAAGLLLQYVSRLHGPHLFMSTGPSTGMATRMEGCCTLAQMAIATAVEAEPSKIRLLHALAYLGGPVRRMGTAAGFYGEARSAAHTKLRGSLQGCQRVVP